MAVRTTTEQLRDTPTYAGTGLEPAPGTTPAPTGGGSAASSSAEAARAAVREAFDQREPRVGDLVVMFATPQHDFATLYAAATEAAHPAVVVGCMSFAAFTDDRQVRDGCVAAVLPADRVSYGICHAHRDPADIAGSTRRAVESARDRVTVRHAHEAVLLLTDGLTPDQREVARGAYESTGARVPFVGGAAADNLEWTGTPTFGDGTVLTDGILAVWLSSPRPLAVSVGHGWRAHGRPMLVTRAEGTVVRELDGGAALPAYLAEVGDAISPDEPDFFQRVIGYPVGVPNGRGRYDVRQLHAYLPDGGGLNFNTGFSDHSIVQVMDCDADSLIAGARDAARQAAAQLQEPARLALTFSCVSRVALLGERLAEEAQTISAELGGAQVCGFFTFGEFARMDGSSGIHNSSVALLVT